VLDSSQRAGDAGRDDRQRRETAVATRGQTAKVMQYTHYSLAECGREAKWEKETVTCICYHFYCAVLCIRGTSHGPVSVCPSVTSQSSIETAERIELVFGV